MLQTELGISLLQDIGSAFNSDIGAYLSPKVDRLLEVVSLHNPKEENDKLSIRFLRSELISLYVA